MLRPSQGRLKKSCSLRSLRDVVEEAKNWSLVDYLSCLDAGTARSSQPAVMKPGRAGMKKTIYRRGSHKG